MNKNFTSKQNILDIIKATLLSIIFTIILVMVFSIIVNYVKIAPNIITIVNQCIKFVSILLGCIISIKNLSKGALKGGLIGILYTLLSVLMFSLVTRQISLSLINLIDIVFAICVGCIGGIIVVNTKKNKG